MGRKGERKAFITWSWYCITVPGWAAVIFVAFVRLASFRSSSSSSSRTSGDHSAASRRRRQFLLLKIFKKQSDSPASLTSSSASLLCNTTPAKPAEWSQRYVLIWHYKRQCSYKTRRPPCALSLLVWGISVMFCCYGDPSIGSEYELDFPLLHGR